MRSLPSTYAVVFACCLSGLSLAAQQAKPTLELRTATGQTTFHIGERIALKLTLTGPDDSKYSIDTAGYDRSGRLDIDTFEVSPASGWADPLAQYFSRGAFMGGGLRGSEMLSHKPVSFEADLNEHVRFDQPGTYTVIATSHRVGTAGKSLMPTEPYLSICSNPVEIHIVPATPEWQAEKLSSVLKILAAPVKKTASGMTSEERVGAVADLRFLDSPAALEVLASDLREDSDDNNLMFSAALGLAGVPDSMRDTAIHAMARKVEDPTFPVTSFFLEIMAELRTVREDTPAKFDFAGWSGCPEFKTVWELAVSGLERKQATAMASTAETLLSDAPGGETAELKARIAAAVAKSFSSLPIGRQVFELENNWDELSKQPMLPVLQAVLHQPPPKVRSPFYYDSELTAIVLKRLYELDPEGAADEVSAQLASHNAGLRPETVGSLPGGPQPQLERAWAKELVESEDDDRETLLGALLVRFGMGSATGQVEARVSSLVGKWACAPQAAALAYLVKFNSENAASLVQRALASTHPTQCYDTLFSSVSAYAYGPALDEAAIQGLQSTNPLAAADAAEYLRSFGTASSKEPLLERYRKWSERSTGKTGDLDPGTETGYPLSVLGQSLGKALIANQGWLADPKLIAEVVSRCIGEETCRELQQLASEASSPKLNVSIHRDEPYKGYQIGQYSCKSLELFEAKLAQFPAGTKFTLIPVQPRNGDQLKLEKEVQKLFAKHGLTLELVAAPAGG